MSADATAVREGLINAIEALRVTVHRAPSEEFAMLWRNVHRAIDALLAAVSRPAEARGEPVAWCPRLVDGRLQIEHATADKAECEEEVRMLNLVPNASTDPRWQPVSVQPLYAHPAPSGGEELTETQRVAIALMGDCWLARSLKTPEQLRDHYIEYGRQEAEAAAPRPETGEVSKAAQALVEKLDVVHADPRYMGVWMGAVAHGGEYVGPTYDAELNALRAALAAQRGEPSEAMVDRLCDALMDECEREGPVLESVITDGEVTWTCRIASVRRALHLALAAQREQQP